MSLLLSPWIIYAKRTAGHKKREEKNGKDSLSHPTKIYERNKNKKKEYLQLCTIDTIFLGRLFYLLALLVNDRFTFLFFFFSQCLHCYVSNMCEENKKKEEEKNKKKKRKISFDHDHMMIMMMIIIIIMMMMVMNISTRLL